MKKSFFAKKIPTLLGLLLLLASLVAGFFLIERQNFLNFKNKPQLQPQNITITNITHNSFTVSWLTEEPTWGAVVWGEEEKKLNNQALDLRQNLKNENKKYLTHYINLENLQPQKTYFFKIASEDPHNLYDDQGKTFKVTTGPFLGNQPPNDIIYGKVVDEQQKPVEGAIVYLSLANGSPLSALTAKDGMWAKPLHTSRTSDLKNYLSYDAESSIITLKAVAGPKTSQSGTLITTTKNDKPVPTLVLNQNQDFRQGEQIAFQNLPEIPKSSLSPSSPEPLPLASPSTPSIPTIFETSPQQTSVSPTPSPSTSFPTFNSPSPLTSSFSSPSSQPSFQSSAPIPQINFSSLVNLEATPTALPTAVTITNPSFEGEILYTQKPQILGTGPAKKTLTIIIQSPKKYLQTVIVDDQGHWQFNLPENLSLGNHTLTVSYLDEKGQEQKIVRTFIIANPQTSAGETPSTYLAFESTPSASLIPSSSPSPSASPPPRVSQPATDSAKLKPGNITPTLLITLLGFFCLSASLLWPIFSSKKTK